MSTVMDSSPDLYTIMNERRLRSGLDRIRTILNGDGNVGGSLQYIEHLAWVLFLKFFDHEERRRARAAAARGEQYTPVIPPDLAWDAWAGPTALQQWDTTNGSLVAFVRHRLIPGLARLEGSPLADTISAIFTERVGDQKVPRNVVVCSSDANLRDLLAEINSIDFDRDDDIFIMTRMYEEFLAIAKESRIAGEFHTPRPIIRFAVEVIDPAIGETVYDPAFGSAGFLTQAYLWMESKARTEDDLNTLRQDTFHGREKKGMAFLIGTMNLLLHGVTEPHFVCANTLAERVTGPVSEQFDVILANPPFGVKERTHIQQNFPVPCLLTELLFLQHIMRKLKPTPNARAAVVMPEGFLFRDGVFTKIKRMLLDEFHLYAVILLPSGSFAPYSDVKTAILFFRRREESLARNPNAATETWYYEVPPPDGRKSFGKNTPLLDKHFDEARQLWYQWKRWLNGEGDRPFLLAREVYRLESTDYRPYWVETLDDIRARGYDLGARNPYWSAHTVTFPKPDVLTTRLIEHQRDLRTTVAQIHGTFRHLVEQDLRGRTSRMTVISLSDLCTIVNGVTPKRDVESFFGGDIPFVIGPDIEDDRIRHPQSFITERAVQRTGVPIVPAGNVLLVTRAAVGKVAYTEYDVGIGRGITGLIVDPKKVDARYLYYWLRSRKQDIIRLQRGTTIKGIRRADIDQIGVPIPFPEDPDHSLAVQRRIATLMDMVHSSMQMIRSMLDDAVALEPSVLATLMHVSEATISTGTES